MSNFSGRYCIKILWIFGNLRELVPFIYHISTLTKHDIKVNKDYSYFTYLEHNIQINILFISLSD